MSERIWKYSVPSPGATETRYIPAGAKIVKVDNFNMWAIVNDECLPLPRTFTTVATGQEFPLNATYVGTFLEGALPFVWHVLEVG